MSQTCTEDVVLNLVVGVVAWGDVDEGIIEERFLHRLVVGIATIVVVTIAAAEDVDDASLVETHVGRGLQHVGAMYHAARSRQYIVSEVGLAKDVAAQVVATIYIIAHVREAQDGVAVGTQTCTTDMGLGMSQNISDTGSTKRLEHAAVAQVYMRVATNKTFQSAAIDIITLHQVVEVAHLSRTFAVQVDGGAVVCVVDIVALAVLLTHNTFLATAVQLEGITLVQVDGGGAPDL